MMHDESFEQGAELSDSAHEEILATGHPRFPEESFLQLRSAGASEEEALQLLGYGPDRTPLGEKDELASDRPH